MATGITIKLLSALISLAMMLTGSYGAETPEPASRTLTISNAVVTIGDETVALNPTLTAAVSTEPGKALVDFAVNAGDKALFPMQLSVTEEALTLLAKNAGASVTVTSNAIDALTESAVQTAETDEDASAILTYLTQELWPAYSNVLEAIQDPEYRKALEEKSDAIYDELVDRGEGKPDTVNVDGSDYDVATYAYTLDGNQLVALAERLYRDDETLNAYYEAILKLYDMMPEESGLNGLTSLGDVFERTGMSMSADIVESRNEDGTVVVTDVTYHFDFSGMTEAVVSYDADEPEIEDEIEVDEDEDEDEDEAAVGIIGGADGPTAIVADADLPPMEMTVHTEKLGDASTSVAHMDYAYEDTQMVIDASSAMDGENTELNFTMDVTADENGIRLDFSGAEGGTYRTWTLGLTSAGDDQNVTLFATSAGGAAADTADWEYSSSFDLDVEGDGNPFSFSLLTQGVKAGDGTGSAKFSIGGEYDETRFGLVFDADVTDAAIEDAATGHDGLVIDDAETLENLFEDETAMGTLMQLAGSLTTDSGALMKEESVVALVDAVKNLYVAEIDDGYDVIEDEFDDEAYEDEYDDDDDEEEMIEDDFDPELEEEDLDDEYLEGEIVYSGEIEGDEEIVAAPEPEDDGELGYDEPAFGYLPEGMRIISSEVDTAYDTVSVTIADDDYANLILATFNPAIGAGGNAYTMDADGKLVPAGSEDVVQVTESDPGNWVASVTHDGVEATLYISAESLDLDAVAQIINGLTF